MKFINSISQNPYPIRFWLFPPVAILLYSALADVTLAKTFDLVVLIPDELQSSIFAESLVQIGQLATERINSDAADLTSLRLGGHTLRIKRKVVKCNERAAMKGVIDALLDTQQNSNTAAFIGKSNAHLINRVRVIGQSYQLGMQPIFFYSATMLVHSRIS